LTKHVDSDKPPGKTRVLIEKKRSVTIFTNKVFAFYQMCRWHGKVLI